jgi:hypothetical protein
MVELAVHCRPGQPGSCEFSRFLATTV